MEREVGGGIGMGNTCKPMVVSFQRMTKFTTNKKLKKKKNPGLLHCRQIVYHLSHQGSLLKYENNINVQCYGSS